MWCPWTRSHWEVRAQRWCATCCWQDYFQIGSGNEVRLVPGGGGGRRELSILGHYQDLLSFWMLKFQLWLLQATEEVVGLSQQNDINAFVCVFVRVNFLIIEGL